MDVRTLQAAARTGRLDAHFSVRSAFERPIRHASRAAGDEFIARPYRCFSGQEVRSLHYRPCPMTTMIASEVCVGECASRKTH